jgi:hypothetical protein
MKYIEVRWKHQSPDDPVMIYSELDADSWELRKVELYADGRKGFADSSREVGGSMLGLEPLPELAEIAAQPEFEPSEITPSEFEAVWTQATLSEDNSQA